LDWTGLINDALVAEWNNHIYKPEQVMRSMHQTTLRQGEWLIRFKYGILNPEYPSVVARKQYILDYDCFKSSDLRADRTEEAMLEANEIVSGLFERSIDQGLRDLMGRAGE